MTPHVNSDAILAPPPAPTAIVIMYDESDDYTTYASAISRLKVDRRSAEVHGDCSAACTMVLEIPDVCVGKDAVFRWKAILNPETSTIDKAATDSMLERLPPTVYSRLYGTVKMTYTSEATLYHDDLINLGVHDCPSRKVSYPVKSERMILNPPPGKGPVVIRNDGGGFVVQYATAVERLAYSGRRVEVRGSCRSACTMVLELPNVCIDKNAEFKWHQAYDKYTGVRDYATTQWMLNRLPTKIRARIEGQVTRSYSEKTTLRYDDLRALGVADCDSVPVIAASSHALDQKTASVTYPVQERRLSVEALNHKDESTSGFRGLPIRSAFHGPRHYRTKRIGPLELVGRTIVSAATLPFRLLENLGYDNKR